MSAEAENPTACPDPLVEEYTYATMFGSADVFVLQTEEGTPLRVLYVGGGFQSATYLGEDRFTPVFAYCRAIDLVFHTGRDVRRMLMIGGGGFSYPEHLLMSDEAYHKAASIDVVEIDPAIVDIARRHFHLDEVERLHGPQGTGRLGVLVADGVEVLRTSEPALYDVVVNDSFDGDELSDMLFSPDVLLDAKRCLKPDGIYLANVIAEDAADAEPFAAALRAAFTCVYWLPCPDDAFEGSCNSLLVATDVPLQDAWASHPGSAIGPIMR